MTIQDILPHINRGNQWLYNKIDRLKELDCIKELYLEDPNAPNGLQNKKIKHLIANEKMVWKTLVSAEELLKIYKNMANNEVFGGIPNEKIKLSNGSKMSDFEGGYSNFFKNVLLLLKDSISIKKNHYITHFDICGKPPENNDGQQEKKSNNNKNGKPTKNLPNTYGTECKTPERLHEKIRKLRKYITDNKEAGYSITYDTLTYSFDKAFIDECIARQILVKNGDEYICA